MLNRTLQAICTNEGLNKNGVKAELQQRIIDRMYKRPFLLDSRYSHLLPACQPYKANIHLIYRYPKSCTSRRRDIVQPAQGSDREPQLSTTWPPYLAI
jgi:hypothetical protein